MRPSALPMLKECNCWESSESTGKDYKDGGNLKHGYFAALLSIKSGLNGFIPKAQELEAVLSEEDQEAVRWAVDYVECKAPTSMHPLRLEYHVNPLDSDFNPIFENGGTLDAACGPMLFDLKSRERNYDAQMAAYALDMFQEHGWREVTVHLLFTETKRAKVFKFTEAEAVKLVGGIVAAVKDPNRKPSLCDYCGWCARRLSCSALLEKVNTLAANRDDWKLEQWHASKIETPEDMGKALRLARAVAEWCESVEFHAKEMATKKGITPAGFKLQQRAGNRFITSVTDAFSRLGLPQEEFLKACEIKPSAAFEAYATFNGLKKATAEKEAERKLGDAIQRKPSTVSLVAEKTKE